MLNSGNIINLTNYEAEIFYNSGIDNECPHKLSRNYTKKIWWSFDENINEYSYLICQDCYHHLLINKTNLKPYLITYSNNICCSKSINEEKFTDINKNWKISIYKTLLNIEQLNLKKNNHNIVNIENLHNEPIIFPFEINLFCNKFIYPVSSLVCNLTFFYHNNKTKKNKNISTIANLIMNEYKDNSLFISINNYNMYLGSKKFMFNTLDNLDKIKFTLKNTISSEDENKLLEFYISFKINNILSDNKVISL